ncbi:hypothetical protein NC653_024269 [Populus alba x Populus x berolinensis]|uniref:Uncharacterized protein n=1 Tax=Populus alba x Populus x berolinensis TaxID=444605 RepID=A0AAD6M8B7_9ROSI|nr:hypothetical protein NC653_024269 [Populus alba x Populus x berolinensis]
MALFLLLGICTSIYGGQVPASLWRLGIVLKKTGLWCSSSVNVLKVERIDFNEYNSITGVKDAKPSLNSFSIDFWANLGDLPFSAPDFPLPFATPTPIDLSFPLPQHRYQPLPSPQQLQRPKAIAAKPTEVDDQTTSFSYISAG